MRVLLATGVEEIDNSIREKLAEKDGIEYVQECYFREGILPLAKGRNIDVVVVSPHLPGRTELIDLIREIRMADMRVVLLPGREDSQLAQDLAAKAFAHGVYDIVWDPVSAEETVKLILEPNTYAKAGMAPDENAVEAPKPKRAKQKSILGLFSRKQKTHVKKEGAAESPGQTENREEVPTPESADLLPPASGHEPEIEQSGKAGSSETVFIPKSIGLQPQKEEKAEILAEKQTALPEDFALLGSEKFPAVSALLTALPGDYSAVVIPSDLPNLVETIKQFRREPSVSALSVVVVGPCDAKECYAAGADECVDLLDDGTIERVRAKAARMKELWAQAERDPLTGLYNRRFLEKYLAEKERQFKEKGVPFSVALLDLDRFKNINDTYGHQAGDVLLKELAVFLCQGVRKTDVVSRYGGEEFMVVLLGTRNAWGIVERLRRSWAGREIALPGREAVKSTFSAGLATIGKDAANCSDLIKAADKALYRAKERGRNRVEMDVKKLYVAGAALKLRLPKEIKTTKKPSEADFALVDAFSYRNVPDGVPLIVVKSGTVADFPVLTTRPDAVLLSPEEAVRMIADLFMGIRSNEPVSIPVGLAAGENKGVIYVVCPARPESAGEVAAEMARKNPGSALVCASSNSTGALALGMPPEDLICSDWRLPGSSAPVVFNGVTVWPVDPLKYLDIKAPVDELVSQISRKFPLVVVDCSGNLELCAKVPKSYKVVLINHSPSKMAELWLKNYGGENVEVVA